MAMMKYIYQDDTDSSKIVKGEDEVGLSMEKTFEEKPEEVNGDINDAHLKNIMKSLKRHYNSDSFVRGHLINNHFEGPAEPHNLFPITYKANSNHSEYVENKIKKLMTSKKSYPIEYYVEIIPSTELCSLNPACIIECTWSYFDKSGMRVTESKNIESIPKGKNIFGEVTSLDKILKYETTESWICTEKSRIVNKKFEIIENILSDIYMNVNKFSPPNKDLLLKRIEYIKFCTEKLSSGLNPPDTKKDTSSKMEVE